MFGHQNPWVIAQKDKDLSLECPPQTPLCNSERVSQHHSNGHITNMDLRTIVDTTSYPWITRNRLTFFIPSLPLLQQSVKIYQSEKKHRGPSNLVQTTKPRLRWGDALCLVAPATLQKSFMEHTHQMTKLGWPMSWRDYSNFLVF